MPRPITSAASSPLEPQVELPPAPPRVSHAKATEATTTIERCAAERQLAASQSFPFEGACLQQISALRPGEFLEVSLAGEVVEAGMKVGDDGRARVERRADGSFTVEMLAGLGAAAVAGEHHGAHGHRQRAPEGMARFEVRAGTTLRFDTAEAAADYCGAAVEAGCHVVAAQTFMTDPTSVVLSGYAMARHLANGEAPLGGPAEQRVAHYLAQNAIGFTASVGGKLEAEAKVNGTQTNLAVGAALSTRVDLEKGVQERAFSLEGEGRLALTGASIDVLENQRGFGAHGEWKVGVSLIQETPLSADDAAAARAGRPVHGGEPEYFVELEAQRTFDTTLYVAEFKQHDTVKIKVPLEAFRACHGSQAAIAELIARSPTELETERVKNDNALTLGFDLEAANLTAQAHRGSVDRFEGHTLEAALSEAAEQESHAVTLDGHRALAALRD